MVASASDAAVAAASLRCVGVLSLELAVSGDAAPELLLVAARSLPAMTARISTMLTALRGRSDLIELNRRDAAGSILAPGRVVCPATLSALPYTVVSL